MYDIITIGSATRDVFMTSKALHPHRAKDVLTHLEACFPFGAKINVDEIFFTTGGGATNNAATFARLGKFRTAVLCRIGNDSAGKDVFEGLRRDRVDTRFIQTSSGHKYGEHTAFSTILSPGGTVGERTILVYRGASARFNHAKILWGKLRARWFYLSSLGGDIVLLKKILDHAKRIGAHVVMNPGGQELKKINRALFQRLDFLILNREEAARLTGKPFKNTKALLAVLRTYAPAVIMTDGPRGAYAVTVKTAYAIPSVGHKPKNITGAGDAFGSGFITGWMKSNGEMIEALRVGSLNADSVVQHVGAKVGILRDYPSARTLTSLPVKKIKL